MSATPAPPADEAAIAESPRPRWHPQRSDIAIAILLPFCLLSVLRIVGVAWWPWPVRAALAVAWLAAVVAGVRFAPRRLAWVALLAGILVVQAGWMQREPKASRMWIDMQDRTPSVAFDGSLATIQNVRNVAWRSNDDRDVRWETRTYDLDAISSVEFVITTFGGWRGLAHTFVAFGFDDGRRLAVSVEVRRERDESYHPFDGLFRNYEIAYVVADERDAIGSRAFVQRDPTTLYPIKSTREARRRLLEGMLRRADELGRKPEFYNTLTNNCTTNVVVHYEQLMGRDLGVDWRIVLPGYSDDLVFELGMVDTDLTLDEARKRFRIADQPPKATDEIGWSKELRETLGQ